MTAQGPELLCASCSHWCVVTARHGSTSRDAGSPCEDAVGAELHPGRRCVLAVADGVGGGARGDVCSAAAVRHILLAGAPGAGMAAEKHARLAVDAAGDAVSRALARITTEPGATTIAAAWLDGAGCGYLAHLGDSRAYIARAAAPRSCVRQVTRDHTYRNLGLCAPASGSPDDPARMLGLGWCGPPDVCRVHLAPGDLLLLCTDGVHAALPSAMLSLQLKRAVRALRSESPPLPETRLAALAQSLVAQVAARECPDDAAIVLAWRRPMRDDGNNGN